MKVIPRAMSNRRIVVRMKTSRAHGGYGLYLRSRQRTFALARSDPTAGFETQLGKSRTAARP